MFNTVLIEVKQVPGKGRGIFAKRAFKKGDLIESAPVIVLSEHEEPEDTHVLYHYTFAWGKGSAIALGYASLYNHSYTPNAHYFLNHSNKTVDIFALHDIEEGEEIMHNYNGDPNCKDPLWFEV